MKKTLIRFSSLYSTLLLAGKYGSLLLNKIRRCAICHCRSSQHICALCRDYLTINHPCCQRCGEPLHTQTNVSRICGHCLKRPPAIDNTFAPFVYRPPLDKLIYDFKQNKQVPIGHALGELMVHQLRQFHLHNHQGIPDYLVAVPLHWRQLWHRGFNQSGFLAQLISGHIGIPLLKGLQRTRRGSEQKQLTRKQRLQNLKNCFTIKANLHGEHIAIVDDVMTTGATANTIAALLKKAGAGTVSVWVIARTPNYQSQK